MKTCRHDRDRHSGAGLCCRKTAATLAAVFLSLSVHLACGQTANGQVLAQKIQQLTDAIAKTQAQLEESQRELNEMRRQVSELQRQLAQGKATGTSAPSAAAAQTPPHTAQAAPESIDAAIDDLREHQALQESEIATQEQSKVESSSKYPVKVTGLLLMNGFVNTSAVDIAADPSVAIPGSGTAGASLQQTILGLDANGPHLFGGSSFADLRVDFFGNQTINSALASYSGYYSTNSPLVRLRTAHAGLYWDRSQIYFALDRPILNPDAPTSLTATAVPALAWSGNLWTWNPQVVFTQDFARAQSAGFELQAAMIDVGDAPLTPVAAQSSSQAAVPPSSAELSSRPGTELHISYTGAGNADVRSHFGMGGYFAPHTSSFGPGFDSWAATVDARFSLPARLELSGNIYRGAALGGLGGGGFKDFGYNSNPLTNVYYVHALNDTGGWLQLKEKFSERIEFNAAYGLDDVFAGQLRRYYVPGGSPIENLAGNRTYTGNVIYSPSAYLLFSLEYRHLNSAPVIGSSVQGNIIGLAAGFKF